MQCPVNLIPALQSTVEPSKLKKQHGNPTLICVKKSIAAAVCMCMHVGSSVLIGRRWVQTQGETVDPFGAQCSAEKKGDRRV